MSWDIRMPLLGGLAATRAITSDPGLDGVEVIVRTTFEIDEYVFEAVRGGASGSFVKDTEPDELLRGVRPVMEGGRAVVAPV